MSKTDPKMGARTRSFFGHLAPFFRARRPWKPKWLPSLPQEPPRPVQASISIDFWSILDDLLMIFCIMWATFYLVCLITFLVTSSLHFQISGHKFKCVGVVSRVKRKRVPATVLSLSDSRHWEKGENSRSTDGVFSKGVGNMSSEVVGVKHQLFTSCLLSNVHSRWMCVLTC